MGPGSWEQVLLRWGGRISPPSHPLISAATQDRADPSEDRSLACSVEVSLGSECAAPLTSQKPVCHLLNPSQPEKGACFDSHSLVYSPWSTSKTAKCQVPGFLPQAEPHPSPCGPLELYPAGSGVLQ